MPKKSSDPQVQEWLSAGFKGLVITVFTIATAAVNQLSNNISSLTSQLKTMEAHQIDTDKRVAAIEVSREINLEAYKKVVSDVSKSVLDIQEVKNQLNVVSLRVQTIADFVARKTLK